MPNKIFRVFKCPHCKAPIYWAVKVANDNIRFYLNIVLAALLGAFVIMNSVQHRKINKLNAILDNPEYCIEQCSVAFEIMGC